MFCDQQGAERPQGRYADMFKENQRHSHIRSSYTSHFILIPLLIFFLVGVANAAGPSVAWEPTNISKTLGNGLPAEQTVVTFKVSDYLENADVFITPEIAGFVQASPMSFARLEPGVEYSLTLNFSVPRKLSNQRTTEQFICEQRMGERCQQFSKHRSWSIMQAMYRPQMRSRCHNSHSVF